MNVNEIPIQQFDRRDKLMKGKAKSKEPERARESWEELGRAGASWRAMMRCDDMRGKEISKQIIKD
jgi:hypothetical protein